MKIFFGGGECILALNIFIILWGKSYSFVEIVFVQTEERELLGDTGLDKIFLKSWSIISSDKLCQYF